MSRKPGLVNVSPRDGKTLEAWTRAGAVRPELARRARIVLLAAAGMETTEIMREVGLSRPTVIAWKKRYQTEGLAGLEDRPRPSRRPRIAEADIVARTLEPPPEAPGVTRWSSRLLGAELGLSNVYVAKVWRRWGLQPWRQEPSRFPTDPELEATPRDLVGLYLHPPEKALMLSTEKEPQLHPPDRPQPTSTQRPGRSRKCTHHDRPGTTTEITALANSTGTVHNSRVDRHRDQQFLRFLEQVAMAYPRVELHGLVHPHVGHDRSWVKDWLERNPRIVLHATPTAESWLKLVEVFVWIMSRRADRCGSSASVDDLTTAIRSCVDCQADRCFPHQWINRPDLASHR
jgi:transposase